VKVCGVSEAPIVISTSSNAVVTGGNRGFDLHGVSWVTISGLIISNTVYEGIRCTLCANVVLSNNTIQSTGNSGILTNSSSDVSMSGNGTRDTPLTGIDIEGSTRISIAGGYVHGPDRGSVANPTRGLNSISSSSLVDGTEVYNYSDTGVYMLDSTTGVRVRHVLSHDNARTFYRAAAGVESRSDGNIVESCITYRRRTRVSTCIAGTRYRREIAPLLLKGAIPLFLSVPERVPSRMTSDLDLAVEPTEEATAQACLEALGYAPVASGTRNALDTQLLALHFLRDEDPDELRTAPDGSLPALETGFHCETSLPRRPLAFGRQSGVGHMAVLACRRFGATRSVRARTSRCSHSFFSRAKA
jgi:hypothetical protein